MALAVQCPLRAHLLTHKPAVVCSHHEIPAKTTSLGCPCKQGSRDVKLAAREGVMLTFPERGFVLIISAFCVRGCGFSGL